MDPFRKFIVKIAPQLKFKFILCPVWTNQLWVNESSLVALNHEKLLNSFMLISKSWYVSELSLSNINLNLCYWQGLVICILIKIQISIDLNCCVRPGTRVINALKIWSSLTGVKYTWKGKFCWRRGSRSRTVIISPVIKIYIVFNFIDITIAFN